MAKRRVVITGLGVVSALQDDLEIFWNRLLEGYSSGIVPLTRFDVSKYPVRLSAAKFRPPTSRGKIPGTQRNQALDRFSVFAMVAGIHAVADSGIDFEKNRHRCGVVVGSGIGGIDNMETEFNCSPAASIASPPSPSLNSWSTPARAISLFNGA